MRGDEDKLFRVAPMSCYAHAVSIDMATLEAQLNDFVRPAAVAKGDEGVLSGARRKRRDL